MGKKRIEFLTNNFIANSEGEQVIVQNEDDKYLYYEDGWNRWTYIEKTKEGIEFKYI